MELSKLQTKILNESPDKTVVISAAASGKTRLLTEKTRQIIRSGIDPHEIAVITFTNMAAGELKSRLGDDYKDGLFIGTIHSLANQMLLRGGVKTGEILDEENFDKLFPLIKQNPQCVRPIEWLLLDEAQDSNKEQFEFIFDIIKPRHYFICGDPRQSIYGFNGAKPKLMMNLARKSDVRKFSMNENYRNKDKILSYAKDLIDSDLLYDDSIAMREGYGEVNRYLYSFNTIIDLLRNERKYGDWAILTRTNAEISQICSVLAKYNIPYDTFKQGDLEKAQLNDKMEANTVKVLTVHSAKGLEWPNVIVLGMRYYDQEERNVCYVAATRARDKLIWLDSPKKKTNKYKYGYGYGRF